MARAASDLRAGFTSRALGTLRATLWAAARAVPPALASAPPLATQTTQPVQPTAAALPSGPLFAPDAAGTVVEQRLYSQSLARELPYRVYLPIGYDQPTTPETPPSRYPVLSLLHGLGGSKQQWSRLGAETGLDRQSIQAIVVTPADCPTTYASTTSTSGRDSPSGLLPRQPDCNPEARPFLTVL